MDARLREVNTAANELIQTRRAAISPECARIIEQVRARCPDAFVGRQLKPSELGPPVDLNQDETQKLFSAAFVDAATDGAVATEAVLWVDGASELLVFPTKARLATADGFAIVGITVQCDETGGVEIVVPFALGSGDLPTGMMVSTESKPRGPAVVVDVWGDRLIATAWAALTGVATSVAHSAGQDLDGESLLPGMLHASFKGLTVTPQARHPFDRIAPR